MKLKCIAVTAFFGAFLFQAAAFSQSVFEAGYINNDNLYQDSFNLPDSALEAKLSQGIECLKRLCQGMFSEQVI